MGPIDSTKEHWRELRDAVPGERFQRRHYGRRERGHSKFEKVFVMLAGSFVLLLGVLMLATPGPGLVLMLVGAVMLAQESLVLARALDSLELWLRRLFARVAR
jgi:hypothetical protein